MVVCCHLNAHRSTLLHWGKRRKLFSNWSRTELWVWCSSYAQSLFRGTHCMYRDNQVIASIASDPRPLLFLLFGLHSHSFSNESRKPFTFWTQAKKWRQGIKAITCLYNNSSTFPALYVAHGSTCWSWGQSGWQYPPETWLCCLCFSGASWQH